MKRARLATVTGIALAGILAVSLIGSLGARRSEAAAPGLSQADVDVIIAQAVVGANATNSPLRSLPGVARSTKMHIAVVARDGRLLKLYSMPDAWVGSIDIAIAKARTAAFFSSDQNALTSRIVGVLSQAHNPDGTGGAGPLWGIGNSNQIGISGSQEFRNGIITFPGGISLYKDGQLVGGVGVSGDGVDQDEAVAFAGAAGFAPGMGVAQLGFPLVSRFSRGQTR
jgi:uncharacterized protein GlcG (DUF336 family)